MNIYKIRKYKYWITIRCINALLLYTLHDVTDCVHNHNPNELDLWLTLTYCRAKKKLFLNGQSEKKEASDLCTVGIIVIIDPYSTKCIAFIFHSIGEWIYVFYCIVCRLNLKLSNDFDLDETDEFKWRKNKTLFSHLIYFR